MSTTNNENEQLSQKVISSQICNDDNLQCANWMTACEKCIKAFNGYKKKNSQTHNSRSIFKIMSGNSELERFRTEEKAIEVCNWYKEKGFPNAKVVEAIGLRVYFSCGKT